MIKGLSYPYCFGINNEGYACCVDQRHYSGYFYKSELLKIKAAVDKTINMYEDEGITDEFVDMQDEQEKIIELERLNKIQNVKKETRKGDLYLILDVDAHLLKIGCSTDVGSRLKQLQTANGHKLELLFVAKKKGEYENMLHNIFVDIRKHGEWFEYSDLIIEKFKELGGVWQNKIEETKEYKEKFANFVSEYKKMGGKVRSVNTEFNDFTKRHKDWQKVLPYLELAVQRETKARNQAKAQKKFFPEPKMLQTYLGKQRAWELYVTIGEDIKTNEYTPMCGGALSWNDYYNCYMYVGYWDGRHIADGYTDDNRPDGASITLNNGRGVIKWNASNKTWDKQ